MMRVMTGNGMKMNVLELHARSARYGRKACIYFWRASSSRTSSTQRLFDGELRLSLLLQVFFALCRCPANAAPAIKSLICTSPFAFSSLP